MWVVTPPGRVNALTRFLVCSSGIKRLGKKNSAEIQTDSRTVEHERRVSNMLQLFHFLLVNPVTVDAMSLPVLVYSGAQKTPTTSGMDDDAELKKASPFSIRQCSG